MWVKRIRKYMFYKWQTHKKCVRISGFYGVQKGESMIRRGSTSWLNHASCWEEILQFQDEKQKPGRLGDPGGGWKMLVSGNGSCQKGILYLPLEPEWEVQQGLSRGRWRMGRQTEVKSDGAATASMNWQTKGGGLHWKSESLTKRGHCDRFNLEGTRIDGRNKQSKLQNLNYFHLSTQKDINDRGLTIPRKVYHQRKRGPSTAHYITSIQMTW